MTEPDPAQRRSPAPFVAPFLLFLGFIVLRDLIAVENPELPWWRRAPEFWIYPLQTVVCLLALAWYWKNYTFKPHRGLLLAICLGLVGTALWITPSLLAGPLGIDTAGRSGIWGWLGFAPRNEGFDPTEISSPGAFAFTVAMRFVRAVICVALVEEIFWRGYLMRLIAGPGKPFHTVPFGTHTWPAFVITTAAFVAVHPSDGLAAAIYGSLTYFLAVRTKSLTACVLMHAVANLALGLYVMATGRWGFW